MNPALHVVSLILASTTGWVLLVLGALPVSVLRQHPREPLVAAAGWAVVSVTAPAAIFHWYLIFAIFCLVAFTRLNRPAGKIWLALTAALGLSLGIIFPLEVEPTLLLREHPYLLASLYLGGAATGLAYVVAVTSRRGSIDAWQPRGLAKGLLIVVTCWLFLLAARPWLSARLAVVPPHDFVAAIFIVGFLLLLLALAIVVLARRNVPAQLGMAGIAAALLALAENGLTQFFYH